MSWGFRFDVLQRYEVDFDAFKDFDLNEENDCKTCKHRRCRHCKHINTFRTVILITVLTYWRPWSQRSSHSFHGSEERHCIILLTLLFASTFAGFVVPILVDEGLHETVVGKILSAIANISEALSILFLTVLMIATDIDPKYWLIILTIGLILIIFRIFRKHAIGKRFSKIAEGVDHLATRVIIILILLLVLLSDLSGGEFIFGASLQASSSVRPSFPKNSSSGSSRLSTGFSRRCFTLSSARA